MIYYEIGALDEKGYQMIVRKVLGSRLVRDKISRELNRV
jgi:hypothetical protein